MQTSPTISLPENTRLYAVGDIHGHAGLLRRLMDKITTDMQSAPSKNIKLVFLGDYVDRGQESRQVLDYLIHHLPKNAEAIFLRGNHEQFFSDFLQGEINDMTQAWFHQYGGKATLASYGMDVFRAGAGGDWDSLLQDAREKVPQIHIDFLKKTQSFYSCGDYYFVHAGINPDYALNDQEDGDLLWIREPFLSSTTIFEKMIVHGHTPVEAVEIKKNRINIDTGAFMTSCLTCLRLDGGGQDFCDTASRDFS